MTDVWTPGPPPVPTPPIAGLPPANSWTPSPPCTSGDNPSFVDGVVITGVPATIVAPYAWGITLNDGAAPPNFSIDHYDGAGNLIDHPLDFSGVDGSAQFATPVFLSRDPIEDMEAATKGWVEANAAGLTDAPEDGQVYGRQNAAWTALPNLPDAPNDGQAYVRLSLGWATLSAQLTGYMPLSGGTFTGPVYFSANNSAILAGPSGSQRAILGVTGNAARWQMLLGDQTAESGTNTGSNFALNAISDTGMLLSTPLAINRSTGAITVGVSPGISPLTLNGPPSSWRSVTGQTNGSMRWQMYLGDFSAELGGNFGSNFQIVSYGDTGAALASPLIINRASGQATFSALPSFPGGTLNYVLATNGAGVLAWAYSLPEAPLDGQQYARRDATWTPFVSGPPTTISDTAPSSPQAGQLWWDSVGGQLYVWYQDANSAQWIVAVNVASALPPASTTTLGGVKVDGTSIKAATDGTISTVLIPMGDNRIINGDMRIDQRNTGAQGTASAYTVDRWQYAGSQANRGTWGRNGGGSGIAGPPGFPYSWGIGSSSAYVSLASDFFQFFQSIEADLISDFQWGTPNAQPVTLSFWAISSLTGTFSASISNYDNTRSYPFTYSIPTVGWTKIAVTIPGDTVGTWVMYGNGGGAYVKFDLGCGSNYRGPANAWAATNYIGVTGAVSIVAVNGAEFFVTGVKLEIGNVATPFNRQSLAKNLADCQRYYSTQPLWFQAYVNAAAPFGQAVTLPVSMRATPTITFSGVTYTNASGVGVVLPSAVSPGIYATATAAAQALFTGTMIASAEL